MDDGVSGGHTSGELTELLQEWRSGDADALSRLMPIVHEELKRIAARYMQNERAEHTLQATALVNEVYLRLAGTDKTRWNDRAHFFAISAQLMRRVLVDHARGRDSLKRGGAAERVALEAVGGDEENSAALDVLDLHAALEKLAAFDAEKAQMIELRYFGGLTLDDTAEVLGLTRKQVWRDCQIARAWLLRELGSEYGDGA